MNNGVLHAAQRVERPADDVLARLREHLHCHVVRDEIVLHKAAQELILRLGRRRESDLDFLESHAHEEVEEGELFVKAHRDHQRLVAVAQIDAAPHGRVIGRILLQPVERNLGRHIVSLGVFRVIHDESPRPCIIEQNNRKAPRR